MSLPVLVVHGGAGNLDPNADMAAITKGLHSALQQGWKLLRTGDEHAALDACIAAVRTLEDDPQFNAGHGAVLTTAGTVELDAAVMEGANLRTGAMAVVSDIPNPVIAARAVMDHSPHVLLAGDSASHFSAAHGIARCNPEELRNAARKQPLKGTVGAVACDENGNCAVAVSTGGMSGQLPGRIGDSPLCGAGFYADDRYGATCATGHGEIFIRLLTCKGIVDAVRDGHAIQVAVQHALSELDLVESGAGGVIAIDTRGEVAIGHTSPHLSWAWMDATGTRDFLRG